MKKKAYPHIEEEPQMASEPMISNAYTTVPTFTPYQMQMLELVSRVSSAEEMKDIRRLLAQYFAEKAQAAIDKLWDDGKINDRVIEQWKHEHMRTPYNQS